MPLRLQFQRNSAQSWLVRPLQALQLRPNREPKCSLPCSMALVVRAWINHARPLPRMEAEMVPFGHEQCQGRNPPHIMRMLPMPRDDDAEPNYLFSPDSPKNPNFRTAKLNFWSIDHPQELIMYRPGASLHPSISKHLIQLDTYTILVNRRR